MSSTLRHGQLLPSAPVRTVQYDAGGGREMPMDVFDSSPGGEGGAPRRAIVFFHGGAWMLGDKAQFHPQCERFEAAGYVAASAAYSVGVPIMQCASDAKAAVEHLLDNAEEWGVDPDRVVVGGGSAGGHLAACLAACPIVRPSVAPAAAVLFNPVLDLAESLATLGELAPEAGLPVEELSPVAQDLVSLPPTVIFHGTKDSLVPIDQSRAFRAAAVAAGARCELMEYEGREHAFFNPVPPEFDFAINAGDFDATTSAALAFCDLVLT